MQTVSNNIRWFVAQIGEAERILADALDKAENFSEQDRQIVDRIRGDVEMVDITLLQLLSPMAPR